MVCGSFLAPILGFILDHQDPPNYTFASQCCHDCSWTESCDDSSHGEFFSQTIQGISWECTEIHAQAS
jgi:hypothetical protein